MAPDPFHPVVLLTWRHSDFDVAGKRLQGTKASLL